MSRKRKKNKKDPLKSKRVTACERKIRHTTIEQAEYHIELLRFKGEPKARLKYYRCPFCSGYHVTSSTQLKSKKR